MHDDDDNKGEDQLTERRILSKRYQINSATNRDWYYDNVDHIMSAYYIWRT